MSRTISVTIDDVPNVRNPKQVASTEYPITAADTENVFQVTIQHNSVAVDLTGLIVGSAYQLPHGEYVTGANAIITDEAGGICTVAVDDSHIPYEGNYICEITVYSALVKLTVAKFQFYVHKSVRDLSSVSALQTSTANFNAAFAAQLILSPHNNLALKQGGIATEYYHLTNAQRSDLTGGGFITQHYHINDDFDGNRLIQFKRKIRMGAHL